MGEEEEAAPARFLLLPRRFDEVAAETVAVATFLSADGWLTDECVAALRTCSDAVKSLSSGSSHAMKSANSIVTTSSSTSLLPLLEPSH